MLHSLQEATDIAEGPLDALSVEILSTAVQLCEKTHLNEKACSHSATDSAIAINSLN